MTYIYDFELEVNSECPYDEFMMPKGAKILGLGWKEGSPVLWAEVDENEDETEHHYLYFAQAGSPLPPDRGTFIGILQMPYSNIVLFVYDEVSG